MSKKAATTKQQADGQAKAKGKEKASNPARNAKEVREFADAFMKWAAKQHATMTEASYRLEAFDPEFRVKLITSMIEKYMAQVGTRVTGQFDRKLSDAIGKERGERIAKEHGRKRYNEPG